MIGLAVLVSLVLIVPVAAMLFGALLAGFGTGASQLNAYRLLTLAGSFAPPLAIVAAGLYALAGYGGGFVTYIVLAGVLWFSARFWLHVLSRRAVEDAETILSHEEGR